MDKNEASQIAEKDLEFYRSLSYDEILSRIGVQESFEKVSDRGEPYQIEFDFMFDDHDEKTIRVWAMVSHSFWTDFIPVTNSFIIAPNGDFKGE